MLKRPNNPDEIPKALPILPLSGALLLPATHRPLNIFEPRYIELVEHILASDRLVGLIQPAIIEQKSSKKPTNENTKLSNIGTLGKLVHFEEIEQERYLIVLEGIARFNLGTEVKTDKPFRYFNVNSHEFAYDFINKFNSSYYDDENHNIDRKTFLSTMRAYAKFAQIEINWEQVEKTDTIELINLAAMLGPYNDKEKQILLEAKTISLRAQTLIALAELEMSKGQSGLTLQ